MAVRLREAGGAIRARFVAEPEPTDVVVISEGIRVFVAASALPEGDAEIAVTREHDELVIRPVASEG